MYDPNEDLEEREQLDQKSAATKLNDLCASATKDQRWDSTRRD